MILSLDRQKQITTNKEVAMQFEYRNIASFIIIILIINIISISIIIITFTITIINIIITWLLLILCT